jgi:integral membrane protein
LISREFVFPLGVAHGALFMVYLTLSLIVSGKQGWSVFVWLLLFSASLIPLAFIPTELFLRKKLSQIQKNPA